MLELVDVEVDVDVDVLEVVLVVELVVIVLPSLVCPLIFWTPPTLEKSALTASLTSVLLETNLVDFLCTPELRSKIG